MLQEQIKLFLQDLSLKLPLDLKFPSKQGFFTQHSSKHSANY